MLSEHARNVLAGNAWWSVECHEALSFLRDLPDDSVAMCCTSPPYQDCRLYLEDGRDLGIARAAEEWVAWMVEVCRELSRVCVGSCFLVVEGKTEGFRYSCTPDLLRADLHRAGFNLRKSPIYHRVGIPGSGGPDGLRNDYEPIVWFTRPGKLPWSDNTAMGHPPKWAPGGEMSHRLSDGARVNQWGPVGRGGERNKDGTPKSGSRPSHKTQRIGSGKYPNADSYDPPTIANPGNVVRPTFSLDEVRQLLAACGVDDARASDVLSLKVGGGQMGNPLCHLNEAPYPEALCEFFIRSFCPEGGVCCDPFLGSGTTGAVALRWGRRFVGCDLRPSQVAIAERRIAGETTLFTCGILH